jgi:hypothetical protein
MKNQDTRRADWSRQPEWKRAAIKAARQQNRRQRDAATVAREGFANVTAGSVGRIA